MLRPVTSVRLLVHCFTSCCLYPTNKQTPNTDCLVPAASTRSSPATPWILMASPNPLPPLDCSQYSPEEEA
jgi:hypothetical protein